MEEAEEMQCQKGERDHSKRNGANANPGGDRDLERWKQLKDGLDEAYKAEEHFWKRKSRKSWLRQRNRTIQFFHATTAERRKRNRVERLRNEEGEEYRGEKKVAREIVRHFDKLFTSDQPNDCDEILEEFLGQFLSQ